MLLSSWKRRWPKALQYPGTHNGWCYCWPFFYIECAPGRLPVQWVILRAQQLLDWLLSAPGVCLPWHYVWRWFVLYPCYWTRISLWRRNTLLGLRWSALILHKDSFGRYHYGYFFPWQSCVELYSFTFYYLWQPHYHVYLSLGDGRHHPKAPSQWVSFWFSRIHFYLLSFVSTQKLLMSMMDNITRVSLVSRMRCISLFTNLMSTNVKWIGVLLSSIFRQLGRVFSSLAMSHTFSFVLLLLLSNQHLIPLPHLSALWISIRIALQHCFGLSQILILIGRFGYRVIMRRIEGLKVWGPLWKSPLANIRLFVEKVCQKLSLLCVFSLLKWMRISSSLGQNPESLS